VSGSTDKKQRERDGRKKNHSNSTLCGRIILDFITGMMSGAGTR
jgi:hypothetical protein